MPNPFVVAVWELVDRERTARNLPVLDLQDYYSKLGRLLHENRMAGIRLSHDAMSELMANAGGIPVSSIT